MKFYFKLLMGLVSFLSTYFGKLKWRGVVVKRWTFGFK